MPTITKLLVANRGEIASRVFRTARQLDIATVAVFSDPDAGAPYVEHADEAVHLPGAAPADTYLHIGRLLAAAEQTGADGVHPGYGFLSERAEFARACTDAGLMFLGPPADAIEAMGSKVTAKALMASAGVPVLPGITLEDGMEVDGSLADRAASEVGFPLLVKAAYGGGGRGMRVVPNAEELLGGVEAARREAAAAFGNGAVFLERYVETPRHIEVQVLGDTHGNVVHLFERECSVQRRYQKIIEEAPSPIVDDQLRAELGAAAVAAARSIGYVGAGTVEFVLDARRNFYFLEVNTRLQVEHPVTECITGLDLVALQIVVAEGHPLPPEAVEAHITGHAIEARLYAEDPINGYLPSTGTVHRFDVPAAPGVRVDSGIAAGSVVGVHYDSMLAKVIAHGKTRDQARRRLAAALSGTRLHGIVSNRDLLTGVLRHPEFTRGEMDTGFLARHGPAALSSSRQHADATAVHALAAALAGQAERRRAACVLASIPSGWRNVPNENQVTMYSADDRHIEVRYRLHSLGPGSAGGRADVDATVDGYALHQVTTRSIVPERVDLEVAGVRRCVSVHRVGRHVYVESGLGSTALVEERRFPVPGDVQVSGSLAAPMPGTVARIHVHPGEQVGKGMTIMILEAMKMEHTVQAPQSGVVTEVRVAVGQTVDVGTVLAVLESSDEKAE